MNLKRWFIKHMLNIYPPYIGTGILVKTIAPGFKYLRVQMKLHWYNRNYVRTHFGGSLYAMTDPFLMLMLIKILGKEYVVWDQAAQIEFIKPGKGIVSAEFKISDSAVEKILTKTAGGEKYFHDFLVLIKDEQNVLIARVMKKLYIRKKRKKV